VERIAEEKFLRDAAEDAIYWLDNYRFPDGSFGKSGCSLKDLVPSSSSPYWGSYLNREILDLVQVPRLISIVSNDLVSMVGDGWEMKEDRKFQRLEMEEQVKGHMAGEDEWEDE